MTSPVNFVNPTGHKAIHNLGGGSSVVVVSDPEPEPGEDEEPPYYPLGGDNHPWSRMEYAIPEDKPTKEDPNEHTTMDTILPLR